MMPQIRRDAYFAPVPDGAYWLTNSGPVLLTGGHIADWVERLSPFLDGRQTLDQLTGRLPEDRAAFVRELVHTLFEKGIVEDSAGEQMPERVARYRTSPTLLVGAGPSLIACVNAGLRSGLSRVTVAVTDDCATDLDQLPDYVLVGESEQDRLVELLAGMKVVVHVADRAGLPRAGLLASACAESSTLLAQAIMTADGAWIGPVPFSGEVGWEAVWWRVGRDLPAPEVGPAATAALAAQLFQRVFREVTGLADGEDTRPRMARFDLSTLHTTSHRVLPHPYARPVRPRTAGEFRQAVDALRRGPRLDAETFSQRAAALVDERLGPFLSIGERDFTQLPLHVCEVRVADPVGVLNERDVPAIAAGPDFVTARHRAALRGFVSYCSMFVDRRRLLPEGRVWGLRMTDGELCQVPADAVFPVRRSQSALDVAPPGAAAGYDWTAAVTAGLVDRGREITVAALRATGRPLSTMDLSQTGLDEVGRTYRGLLAELDEPLVVYDATGSLGLPTFAFCLGVDTVRYSSALSAADALRDGLEQVLLACQARMHGQSAYAPLPGPHLPVSLRGDASGTSGTTGTTLPLEIDLNSLVKALHRDGWTPVAVPLDHDPEMSRILPYVVRVVLTDA